MSLTPGRTRNNRQPCNPPMRNQGAKQRHPRPVLLPPARQTRILKYFHIEYAILDVKRTPTLSILSCASSGNLRMQGQQDRVRCSSVPRVFLRAQGEKRELRTNVEIRTDMTAKA